MNSKTLTIALIITGLFLAALLARSADLAWMALPFLVYLALGVWQSPAREEIRLEAERQVIRATLDEMPVVEVQVTVRNRGANIDRLFLGDTLPEGLKIIAGSPFQQVALPGGEETALRYSFREKRGSYNWKTIHAVTSDPFGLVETQLTLPARAEIQVQPERDPLRRLPLRPRSTLHSPGSIPARLAGSGTDFWGVREYHPGDSLRWLDWRLTARHPRQFFTKEFEQEEIADIGLILDAREKIDAASSGDDSLFERSVSAAAALAEAFLHQGHRVSLLTFGERVEAVFPGYGKVQLQRIMHSLARVKTGSSRSADLLEYLPLHMFSSRALLVVFSPLTRGDWPFFLRLRASGFQGLLVSPDPYDFIAGQFTGDQAGRLALRAARLERGLLLRDIAQLQIPVINWRVSHPLYPLVRRALSHSRFARDARLKREE